MHGARSAPRTQVRQSARMILAFGLTSAVLPSPSPLPELPYFHCRPQLLLRRHTSSSAAATTTSTTIASTKCASESSTARLRRPRFLRPHHRHRLCRHPHRHQHRQRRLRHRPRFHPFRSGLPCGSHTTGHSSSWHQCSPLFCSSSGLTATSVRSWPAGAPAAVGCTPASPRVAFRKYTRLAEEERERAAEGREVANMMPHGVPVSRSAQAGRKVNVRLAIAGASAEGAALAA